MHVLMPLLTLDLQIRCPTKTSCCQFQVCERHYTMVSTLTKLWGLFVSQWTAIRRSIHILQKFPGWSLGLSWKSLMPQGGKIPRMIFKTILGIFEPSWSSSAPQPGKIPGWSLRPSLGILEHPGAHCRRIQEKSARWSLKPSWGILEHPGGHSRRIHEKFLGWSLRPSWNILEPSSSILEVTHAASRRNPHDNP